MSCFSNICESEPAGVGSRADQLWRRRNSLWQSPIAQGRCQVASRVPHPMMILAEVRHPRQLVPSIRESPSPRGSPRTPALGALWRIGESRLGRTPPTCGSFDCNGHTGHLLKVPNEGTLLPCPTAAFALPHWCLSSGDDTQGRRRVLQGSAELREFDAFRGCLGPFAVLLSDSPCQVLACRVDPLTYRWWRRQRGRHHRQTRARVAQIECWVTNPAIVQSTRPVR